MPPIPIPAPDRRCPICGKPGAAEHRPFCSSRCKLIDLGRWLDGSYRFATDETTEDGPDPREDPRG